MIDIKNIIMEYIFVKFLIKLGQICILFFYIKYMPKNNTINLNNFANDRYTGKKGE